MVVYIEQGVITKENIDCERSELLKLFILAGKESLVHLQLINIYFFKKKFLIDKITFF